MNEQVYALSEIPLKQAASLERALRDIDQRRLLNLLTRTRKYSRRSLRTVVERAMAQNAIQAVKGRLHDGTIGTFVNRRTFPAQFSDFIDKVATGQADLSTSELRRLLQDAPRGTHNYTQKVLRHVHSNPILLRMAEWFIRDLDGFIKLADVSRFSPCQIHGEVRGLLNLLADRRPKTVLEIGIGKGGSLYLFTKVADSAASLATIDLRIKNRKLLGSFARRRQRITLIEADSTAPETTARIREMFPDGIDFLFLDGDHSYEGVKKDFVNYSPLVRHGGCIAFHDIVEDNDTRYGVHTGGWSGSVPAFWHELKPRFRHVEFIDNPEQDGLGIGVLFIPETASLGTKSGEE